MRDLCSATPGTSCKASLCLLAAQAKREADAARAAENAARKAEAKKLAAAEEDELASAGKQKAAAAATKVLKIGPS